MSECFPKPKHFEGNVKVGLRLSNYGTKAGLKKATSLDTPEFAKKSDLSSLKLDVDVLDIGFLETAPIDLNQRSKVVNNDVVKKTVYDKLIAKVDATDTSKLSLKTQFNTDKSSLNLIKKADYDAKISNIESKYFTTSGYKKISNKMIENKIKEKESVKKSLPF